MSTHCSITITDTAQQHFSALIDQEQVDGMGLRIFLDRPGSPKAEVGITFCPPGEEKGDDLPLEGFPFPLYVDLRSSEFLEEASIDYVSDALGGELSITAPHLHGRKPTDDAPIFERVTHFLNTEVNPHLAAHGGVVSLVELTDTQEAVVQFGGGCHGCGMVDVTLKEGIEKRLLDSFPELVGVKDATNHETGENPYY